jgi:hypothetical protein
MSIHNKTLIELERKFWQSMVDRDADTALAMLTEPALMVSGQGAMKFDHAGYRKMTEQGSYVLTSYELKDIDVIFPSKTTAVVTYRVKQGVLRPGRDQSITQEMNDSSTWVLKNKQWQCVMHTETPAEEKPATH